MRTFILSIVFIISVTVLDNYNVCPTPATIKATPDWEIGSIYDISFSDDCPRIKEKEVLLSVPLMDAVQTIRLDNNTSYGDFAIGYKYMEDEDLYVANLLDEFKEL